MQQVQRLEEINQFEAVDIDTQEDFDFAKVVAEYLKRNN